MILFTKPYQVIRRGERGYVEGIAASVAEPAPVTLQLNVQPAEGDTLACYANAGALTPHDPVTRERGDIVIVAGRRYIASSVDRWDSFGGAETAHDRYTLSPEIPMAPGEA